ncbi:Gfo/Idh/MocA family oxidoreductase [bacterium]|nr:Gfo/Idh/MocA family oxidoreductase [bacterium]
MIRLAIVGCGGMSRSFTQRFESLKDRVHVTATVDVDRERAERAAACFDTARPASCYEDVLGDVDAGLLVLPHHLHHPIGLAFLNAGKHVLLEKPMANTEQQCLDLIAAADKAQRTLMIGYVMRYNPLVVRLKELLDQKAYGDVFQVSIWTEQYTHYPPGHWALSADLLGGGQLFSHGCHYIDLLLWFLGAPVEGTHLGTNFGTPWMENEGTSNVAMKFESGALGYHFGTWGARGSRLRYAFHAHCTEGMLEIDLREGTLSVLRAPHGVRDIDGKVSAYRETEEEHPPQEVLMTAGAQKHTLSELEHFVECIETGRAPLTDARTSLQSLRVIWRMYEAEQKHVVADLRGLGATDW